MRPLLLFKKFIGYEEIYTIAYRNVEGSGACFIDTNTSEFSIWENLKDYWYADPILFEKDNVSYLFFEMFDRKKLKGEIGVSKFEDGKFSIPRKIIEEAFHMSYPYVFEISNDIYMLPETSETRKLIFYKCIEFPYKWEKHTEINTKELFVDTNIIVNNGNYYLLSSILESNHFITRMHFEILNYDSDKFSISLDKNLQYSSDRSFETRNAGKWIELNGRKLRPSQVSKADSYGYSLNFFEPCIDDNVYTEKCKYELKPEQISILFKQKRLAPLGVHTYARGGNLEIIDVKLLAFNKTKWINRLLRNIYWKLDRSKLKL